MNPLYCKTLRPLVLRILTVALVAAGMVSQPAVTVHAQDSVTIAVTPSTQKVQPGDTFSVTVEVQAGTQPVNTAAVYIDFDPTLIEVTDMTIGSALPTTIENNFNNSNGTINYSAGKLGGTPPAGTFTAFTLELEALTSGDADLTFATEFPRKTDAANTGQSVLDATVPGLVIINLPPTADAGANQAVVDEDENNSELVTLDGTGSSDSDGTISYSWSENGTEIATGATPTVDFAVGTHEVTLTVTDDDGDTDTDTVFITVNEPEPDNVAPTADAGADQTVTDTDDDGSESVTLDGTNSTDSDGTIASYSWGENGMEIVTGVNPTVNLAVGTHEITLTVTDNEGATDTDTVTIEVVEPANVDPVADAGADQTVTDTDGSGDESVTLDGSGSNDPDGTLATYSWEEAGSEIATGVNPSVILPVGTHLLTLIVTDNDGASDSDTVTIVVEQQPIDASVVLAIAPETSDVVVGQIFDVDVEVRAGTQEVDGAAAYINFDPNLLQIVSISAGDELETQLRNDFNNATGAANVAYGTFGVRPSGTFTLATIQFEAIAATDGTPLAFNSQLPRRSDVTFGGTSVLESTVPGSVVIQSASINGSVALEGRNPAPNAAWSIPLVVKFYPAGQTTPIYEYTPTTDNAGQFTLQGMQPGLYDISIKNSHTLQNVLRNVEVTAGTENEVDFGTLREGDANNDNFVSLSDFSLLTTSFNLCAGDAGYDDRPDFDEDDCVSLSDFSLLTNHYDEQGDEIDVQSASTLNPSLTDAGVTLRVQAAADTVTVGSQFDVALQIDAGEQSVDAAGALLTFDPAVLRVVSIDTSQDLSTILLSEYNNEAGTLRYEAGKLGKPFPSGVITLATVRFESIAASDGTSLALSDGSRVYRAGENILATTVDESVRIGPGGQSLEFQIFLPLTRGE